MLSIGALATHTDLIRSPLVRRRLPMLAAACREVGGVQIQNRGTLGGNVANASPAGDTLPVLAAAEAAVVLKSAAGTRRVPFTAFYTGYRTASGSVGRTDRGPRSPRRPRTAVFPEGRHACRAGHFESRHGRRGRRRSRGLRSAASRRPLSGPAHRGGARRRRVDRGRAALLLEEIAPIDDIRSTAIYRRRVAANLLARMLKMR